MEPVIRVSLKNFKLAWAKVRAIAIDDSTVLQHGILGFGKECMCTASSKPDLPGK